MIVNKILRPSHSLKILVLILLPHVFNFPVETEMIKQCLGEETTTFIEHLLWARCSAWNSEYIIS